MVSVSASKDKDGDRAVIRVIDQGTGIAKKDQARIFERFYRGVEQSNRTADGVGLGLAIVKHVALTHHGDVTVWSAPGQGSTFSLTLPVNFITVRGGGSPSGRSIPKSAVASQ